MCASILTLLLESLRILSVRLQLPERFDVACLRTVRCCFFSLEQENNLSPLIASIQVLLQRQNIHQG